MKISRDEKERTRRKLIQAAVRVISKAGFRAATMREIAQEAGVADATIYKYFPTKEDLLYGYFGVKVEELIEHLRGIKDFHQYSFQEQLHVLLETHLQSMEADREFVRIAYEGVFLTSWLSTMAATEKVKNRYLEILADMVDSAIEGGEFPEPPFRSFLQTLFWDYSLAISYAWLKDESEKHVRTTQLIDKSLDVIVSLLRNGVAGRIAELGQFLIREHLLARVKGGRTDRNFTVLKGKRGFMAKGAK